MQNQNLEQRVRELIGLKKITAHFENTLQFMGSLNYSWKHAS